MKIDHLLLTALIVTCITSALSAADDLIIADFESETYEPWKVEGNAFGDKPARGTLPGQMHVDGFIGKGLVNSFVDGDNSTGILRSPSFKIDRKYITFYIGGGKNIDKLALKIIIDGKTVRQATGLNDKPGGSEALQIDFWDVQEYIGKQAVIEILDQAQGGWGHINVDQIVQTDNRPATILLNPTREIKVANRYLHLPIKNGGTKRIVKFIVDGKVHVVNEMELADSEADWWAFTDVSAWSGKNLVVEVNKLPENSTALESIEQSDTIKDSESFYREPLRGQFHFSSRRGWNNDPNGLVFFNGEYHLFYQHNPYGWGWGNMHWGHAISKDMVHWQELRDELAPDSLGPMFSGSAVVDWNNTSGFGTSNKPPMVLIYTAAGSPTVQCIAHSTDGRTFTKYKDNPVLPEVTGGNRDPKVIWHEPSKKWVMVLYVTLPDKKHTVHFFTSSNLRQWDLASVLDGGVDADKYLFECPDFFELPVDGDLKEKRWVLSAANCEYAIGTFDGKTFKPEASRLPGHRGRGYYAPQTFSDIPASDGRRIQIGWFQTSTTGMAFNQSMSIPVELKLRRIGSDIRLFVSPIKEIESLRTSTKSVSPVEMRSDSPNPLDGVTAELVDLEAEWESSKDCELEFNVRGAKIVYDQSKRQIKVNDHVVNDIASDGNLTMRALCDRTGMELFFNNGSIYIPIPFQPAADNLTTKIKVLEGNAKFSLLKLHELKSAW